MDYLKKRLQSVSAFVHTLATTFVSIFAVIAALGFASNTTADYLDSPAVQVELISVFSSTGDIAVQTTPRHNITGLSCSNDFWLMLDKDELGYEATLSMLLSAQESGNKINISAKIMVVMNIADYVGGLVGVRMA